MVKDVFKVHWYWKRFNSPADPETIKIQKELEALLEQRKQARKGSKHDMGSPKNSVEASKIEAITKNLPSRANSKGSEKAA